MGLFDLFKKKTKKPIDTPMVANQRQKKELTYADKERIMVNRVTIEDMRKITTIPYVWNTKIEKFIVPHGHPFAYINLIGPNIGIAKQELEKMNTLISASSKLSPAITKRISIPVDKIIFTPQKYHGSSFPYLPAGSLSSALFHNPSEDKLLRRKTGNTLRIHHFSTLSLILSYNGFLSAMVSIS